jgi:hypothetical protein
MKKLLLTAFEPFGGEKMNSSLLTLISLPDAIGDFRIIKMEVPVIFGFAAKSVIDSALKYEPDVILCLGQAEGRKDQGFSQGKGKKARESPQRSHQQGICLLSPEKGKARQGPGQGSQNPSRPQKKEGGQGASFRDIVFTIPVFFPEGLSSGPRCLAQMPAPSV